MIIGFYIVMNIMFAKTFLVNLDLKEDILYFISELIIINN